MYREFLLFCKIIKKAQLQLVYKLSRPYMFRHYRAIFMELVISSYTRISIAAVGNTI